MEASSVANLVRWKASKVYFARFKANGKLIWKSLNTKLFFVAKNRLSEVIEAGRSNGKTSFKLADKSQSGSFRI
jgi:hypothetical protein